MIWKYWLKVEGWSKLPNMHHVLLTTLFYSTKIKTKIAIWLLTTSKVQEMSSPVTATNTTDYRMRLNTEKYHNINKQWLSVLPQLQLWVNVKTKSKQQSTIYQHLTTHSSRYFHGWFHRYWHQRECRELRTAQSTVYPSRSTPSDNCDNQLTHGIWFRSL